MLRRLPRRRAVDFTRDHLPQPAPRPEHAGVHRGLVAAENLRGPRVVRTFQGAYRLELAEIDLDAILYAGKKGYRTAIDRDIAERLLSRRGGTLFVDLTLGPPPRSISGVLTDGRGIPPPGHLIFLADPLYLDSASITTEALAAGQTKNEFGASDIAGSNGGFKIDGLSDRIYAVRVCDKKTANTTDVGSIAAGRSDVEVKIHEDRFVTMTGKLTDDDGIPVAGAKVYFGSSARKVVPLKSTIHFLNDYGERIDILVLDAQGCRRCESWTIEGDSTQVLCASQRAKTLVLTGPDGMEISRSPIHLVPEFITEIDL